MQVVVLPQSPDLVPEVVKVHDTADGRGARPPEVRETRVTAHEQRFDSAPSASDAFRLVHRDGGALEDLRELVEPDVARVQQVAHLTHQPVVHVVVHCRGVLS